MAISKKGKRKITVGDVRYFWSYKFQIENLLEKNDDFVIENIGDKIDLDSLTKPSDTNRKSKIQNPKLYA